MGHALFTGVGGNEKEPVVGAKERAARTSRPGQQLRGRE